ncbi:carbamoyltransferase HypF [Propionivibrio sp.]|uniref:carbamoyltransferase HypF n=1 Tax=Propionivibrio sp. TaxID=2212460 RepID=UPI0025EF9487|nr:carbamoyltransferase HypF [Propionivibrio sp.]
MQIPDKLNNVCQRIRLSGVAQGVGFRPYIWRLAKELLLTGWVKKDAHGVEIEVCGAAEQVQSLIERLRVDAPVAARIDSVKALDGPLECVSDDFYILNNRGGRFPAMVGHDLAVCRDCLTEMFDPANRRWRYAFAGCSHCGPRYTITRALPFARERTSLKGHAPCAKCQSETRRKEGRHSKDEVICCPKCGPQLALLDADGQPLPGDPITQALALVKQGKIIAIKGMGGFHLACDARNAGAVAVLRERKQRDERPFAVMLANAASASTFVQLNLGEPGLLAMSERPIILLKKRPNCDSVLPGVTNGLSWLGVMIPSTPLQYLLFHEAAGRPQGLGWLDRPQKLALVMTGADSGGEPLVIGDKEALMRLSGVADAFLLHEREIVSRCDDSIARSGPGGLQLVRRGRGYTPQPIKLPRSGPPVLAVGGWFKNTVCVTRGDEAFVSQHIGDLDNAAACDFFDSTVSRLLKLLDIKPAFVAHDLDRSFHSTRYALDFALQKGVPSLAVQHHHAHTAAVLAEHRIDTPVIGLSLDGIGLGTDGRGWGGELLRVDGARMERIGHIAPIQLVGEHALRVPWRLAAAVLQQLGRGQEIEQRFPGQRGAAAVAKTLLRGVKCPETSSLGCYINAAAGLLGVKPVMAFDGQASELLEGMADRYGDILPLNGAWTIQDGCLDLRELYAVLADEKVPERGAAIFHATLVAALADWICAVAPSGSTIVGSGGCFLNQVIARGLRSRLGSRGLSLIEARKLPPNDGGLSVGQAWVALKYLQG